MRQPPNALPLLLLLLLLRPAAASTRCPVRLHPPSEPFSRIVGGDQATPFSASFSASLIQAFASACTGSLLSAFWVLTARHCLPSNATFVFLGGLDRTSGLLLPVRNVFLYPSNPSDPRDDIALVQLSSPAPPNATFVKLNVSPSLPHPGAFVRSIGYGSTVYAGPNNRLLRQVDYPTVSTANCSLEYGDEGVLGDRTLCAGYSAGRCGVCSGDSGGPLVQFDPDGRPVQVGIASRSRGCAWAGTPAIFTRVSAFVDWVEQIGAKFERSQEAVQVGQDGAQVGQDPVISRDEPSDGMPTWKIAVIAGAPILAVLVVAVVVLAGGKIARHLEQRRGGADGGEGEVRDGDDDRGERDAAGEQGDAVDLGEGV